MNYKKAAHSKLHHIETMPNDDGSISVHAHLIHRPPSPDGKQGEHMVPPMHDHPNKVVKMTADSHEEAGEHVAMIHEAHQYESGRHRVNRRTEEAEDSAGETGEEPTED